jgi:hypothetical protein
MRDHKHKLAYLGVATMLVCAFLAFFVKPKAPLLELVSPAQELPAFQAKYPGDTSLSDRILKTYALAMVLVESPYLQKNINSLENIREWARDSFHANPDFLHPANLPPKTEYHDTVFGAIGYNLFAGATYWLQQQVGELLQLQIVRFHETTAFKSFNTAYFDYFGKDADSATLLAKYESLRAKSAVDVVLTSCLWVCFAVGGAVHILAGKQGKRFNRLRRVLSGTWLLLGTCYLAQAWMGGLVSTLASAMFSLAIGTYLAKPCALVSHREAGQRLLRIHLQPRWVALATWLTVTILSIQVLTWIRAGMPNSPDPVTLLLSSLSGNFVHDPVHGKRLIMEIIAFGWLAISFWTMRQQRNDGIDLEESDNTWAGLKTEYSLER